MRRPSILDDVGGFGVSASPTSPLGTPYELDDDEIRRRIEAGFNDIKHCRLKISCHHAPPMGTACDRPCQREHVGSTVIRTFIEREQPDLVFCGHIHESRGTDTIAAARIINPRPASAGHYALVEINDQIEVRLDGY